MATHLKLYCPPREDDELKRCRSRKCVRLGSPPGNGDSAAVNFIWLKDFLDDESGG